MSTSNTDQILKHVHLRAGRSRVWRAITNAREFGAWFGVNLKGEFAEGEAIRGSITYTGFEHVTMEVRVERIVPEELFSYRWHPYAIDPAVDYSEEPTTLVEFRLDEVGGGTRLTIVESGFENIPLVRRAEAFRMDERGWAEQTANIKRHVEQE